MITLIPTRATLMRRVLLLLILISAVSCAPGIYAKTDCDRWLAQYKQALLQKRAVQRADAARRRLKAKLIGAVTPTPVKYTGKKPVLKRRMGPLEALNHFQLACGDLDIPNDGPSLQPIGFGGFPTFDVPEFPYTPAGSLVSDNVPPPLPPSVAAPVTGGGLTPSFPGPIFGTPPIQIPSTPVVPVVPTVPVTPVVPEPSSIVLVLTGVGAAITAGRRRFSR